MTREKINPKTRRRHAAEMYRLHVAAAASVRRSDRGFLNRFLSTLSISPPVALLPPARLFFLPASAFLPRGYTSSPRVERRWRAKFLYLKIFLWRPRCDPLQCSRERDYTSGERATASVPKDSMHPSSGLVISPTLNDKMIFPVNFSGSSLSRPISLSPLLSPLSPRFASFSPFVSLWLRAGI